MALSYASPREPIDGRTPNDLTASRTPGLRIAIPGRSDVSPRPGAAAWPPSAARRAPRSCAACCSSPSRRCAAEGVEDDGQIQEARVRRHVGDVDGLITNDKFCLIRLSPVPLTWPRAESSRQAVVRPYPPRDTTHCGGSDGAPVAGPAGGRPDGRRTAAVGSGVPAPPAVGGAQPRGATGRVDRPSGAAPLPGESP